MYGMGKKISQVIIHQPMSRHGPQTLEAGGHDAHVIVTRAALRASVSGMQVRVVPDVEFDGLQRGQASADERDAVGVVGHGMMR